MMAHACRHGCEESAGAGVRSCGRAGGGPLRQAQRHRGHGRPFGGQMALAGIEEPAPPDQVLDAMAEVGRSLPPSLRETGKGGLAATPLWDGVRTQGGVI